MQKNGSQEKTPERIDLKALVHREHPFSLDDVRLLERLLSTPQVGEMRQEFFALQARGECLRETSGPRLDGPLGVGLYLLAGTRGKQERALARVSGDAVAAFLGGWLEFA